MRVTHTWRGTLLVALVGAAHAVHAQASDTLLVAVDGHRMRMIVSGAGAPTIVLEAGSGGTSRTWRTLQPALAEMARVVAYDRAGLGQSDPSPRPRTAHVIAEELRGALQAAQLRPPYLLVAHSAGGLYARVFAATYPNEVVGLVLVDPAPEDFYARARRAFPHVFAHFDSLDAADLATLPPNQQAEEDAWEANLALARAADPRLLARAARDRRP